jgi:hypothetical protein
MEFRIREGFALFRTMDESIDYRCGNKSIRPRASAGQTIKLSDQELLEIVHAGQLGALEPIDEAARNFYAGTKALRSTAVPPASPAAVAATYEERQARVPFSRGETVSAQDFAGLSRRGGL